MLQTGFTGRCANMATVKVVLGKIIHNKKTYGVGKVVKGLSTADSDRVIKAKIAVACIEDEFDEEVLEEAKNNKTPYEGHTLTQEEKNKLDAESLQEALAAGIAPQEKQSKGK